VTQINAATSEEAAASAQELSAQATQLTHTVDVLVTTVKGSGAKIPSAEQNIVPAPRMKTGKVIPMHKTKRSAASAIPFDDESEGKIGNTSGF
jgi:hypothetical protein